MSYQAIKEYLVAVVDRYKKLNRTGKSKMLDEAALVTKLSRKHLIRLLKKPKETLARRKASGRTPRYQKELLRPHIEHLWIQMERITARRMKAGFVDWLPFYKVETLTPYLRLELESISVSTLERMLRPIRGDYRASKGLSTTCPARFMKNKIPLNTFDAKIDRPAFTQADTVAHCGTSGEGAFASSLTLTDIDSAWTENRAMFTKKGPEVRKKFSELYQALPFDLLAVNTDSGSEFLNNPVYLFMNQPAEGRKKITFTRSRPYKKNDNCYVEQKNFTHVRELFGYERIEDPKLVELMNDIYVTCWNPLQNFFLPTFKLKEKKRVGSKIVKTFDKPVTPYERLKNSTHLSEERKEKLKVIRASLNPFELKATLEKKLGFFFVQLRKSKERKAA